MMVMMFWGKSLNVSNSCSYQVQHVAAQPQAARAFPQRQLKNTCLFAFHLGEKIVPFLFFDAARVNK